MLKKYILVSVLALALIVGVGAYQASATLTLADLALTSSGALTITGSTTGILTLGSSSAAQTLNLGTGAGVSTVNIATGDGVNVIKIGSNTVDGTKTTLYGWVKIDNRLDGAGGTLMEDSLQIRSEYAGTGTAEHNGLDSQSDLVANSGATLIGIKGVVDVKTGITDTGGALIGLYGQARSTGTLDSSTGQLVGVYGLLGNSAAVTVGQAAAGWFDSRLNNTVTGEHELLLLTNTGNEVMDQAISIDGNGLTADENVGDGITNFVKFVNGGAEYLDGVKVTASAVTAGSAAALIRIDIAGTTYYIPAFEAGAVTNE